MSSTQATAGSSPMGSSPFVNINWGVCTHGLEAYLPHLGVDEFAVVNPDFWSATGEEQDTMVRWFCFAEVSLPLILFNRIS